MAQRSAGTRNLMSPTLAHHLDGRLSEADQAGGTDRVRRQHATGGVHRQPPADRRLAGFGELPAFAFGSESEVLQPHRLEPRERYINLGGVDFVDRAGDARCFPQRGRAVPAGLRVDLVAAGVRQRLGAQRSGVDQATG